MTKLIKNIKACIIAHKWQTSVCASVVVLALGVGIVSFATHNQKLINTQKAIEIAEANGGITTETLKELEENGGLAEFGTEIVDPVTGETVVLTQNADGSITKTVTIDSNGQSTGAVIPESHSDGQSSSGHVHSYIPHYSSRTVQTGNRYVVDVPAQAAITEQVLVHGPGYICNTCGAFIEAGGGGQHAAQYGHGGTHSCGPEYKTVVVTPAVAEQGHYEPVYGTEQYVDYYYCSECGNRQ